MGKTDQREGRGGITRRPSLSLGGGENMGVRSVSGVDVGMGMKMWMESDVVEESEDVRCSLHLTPEIGRFMDINLPSGSKGHKDILFQLQVFILLDQRVFGGSGHLVVHCHFDLVK